MNTAWVAMNVEAHTGFQPGIERLANGNVRHRRILCSAVGDTAFMAALETTLYDAQGAVLSYSTRGVLVGEGGSLD